MYPIYQLLVINYPLKINSNFFIVTAAQRTDDAPAYGQRGGSGGYRGADEREPRRSNRPELPVPDKPPFMAFVGNLNFETNETDLELLFRDMSVNLLKYLTRLFN